jgi:hypothetical protein
VIDIQSIREDAKSAERALIKHLEAIRTGRMADDPTETNRLRADLVCRKSDLNFWERIKQRAVDLRKVEPRSQIALFGRLMPLPEATGAFPPASKKQSHA